MWVRTVSVSALALGLVGALSSNAHAINEYHLLAEQLQANAIASESVLEYGRPVGMDPFAARATWLDLRIRNAGSARTTSSRLITAPKAAPIVRTGLRFAPANHVGGLGRQISGNSPSISLHGVESGGQGGTPSFGNLHEGGESFSFSKP